MFTNIGGKIKNLAKVVCWIGIILSVIFAIISIVSGSNLTKAGYKQEGSAMTTSGWTMMILGPLLSWVGSFVLYGFGELIDRAVSIDNVLKNMSTHRTSPGMAPSGNAAGNQPPHRDPISKSQDTGKPSVSNAPRPVPHKPANGSQQGEDKVLQLMEMLENGTITQVEYDQKISQLEAEE